MIGYLYLLAAIGLELLATTLLKYSDGFTRIPPTLGCVAAYVLCFWSLARSLRTIELSVAYATWCGLGIVAATALSVWLFRESLNGPGILGLVLVVAGVVILNLYGTAH